MIIRAFLPSQTLPNVSKSKRVLLSRKLYPGSYIKTQFCLSSLTPAAQRNYTGFQKPPRQAILVLEQDSCPDTSVGSRPSDKHGVVPTESERNVSYQTSGGQYCFHHGRQKFIWQYSDKGGSRCCNSPNRGQSG